MGLRCGALGFWNCEFFPGFNLVPSGIPIRVPSKASFPSPVMKTTIGRVPAAPPARLLAGVLYIGPQKGTEAKLRDLDLPYKHPA